MPNSSEVEAFIEQIKNEFIETTTERLNTVDDLITAIMEDNNAEDALAEFLRHIHSIKGQGATFDFPTVTTVAHKLEDYVETASEHSIAQLRDIQRFVDIIRKIIEAGKDPDEAEITSILAGLPVTAKSFDEVEAFSDQKPIQDVQMLLVMPKSTQRKIIGKELAACGFQVANVDTPVDAIKYAVDHNPDIIIASRIMQQMGGKELARVMSEIDVTKDCHIVVATSEEVSANDMDGMPPSTKVVHKGSDFVPNLTDCLSDWGYFG